MPEFSTQQLSDDLAHALSPEAFDQAAREALTAFDALNAQMLAEETVTLACREGCSLCCWLRVDALAHEIFLIARHVRRTFSEEEITVLLGRLAAHAGLVIPLTPFEHATRNVPCPLLQEGRCSIYAVRPQACRRHHSQDFAACQFTFDHPADLETPAAHHRILFLTLTEAMGLNIEAYAAHGFDSTIYELGSALHEALTEPASGERWRQREPAFLRASITPLE